MENPFANFSAMHTSGVGFAKALVMYGAGFSIGRHAIKTMRGKIRGSVAIAHVIRDAAVCFGVSYVGGVLYGGAMSSGSRQSSVDFGVGNVAANSVGDVVAGSAVGLTDAANNLIDKVTHGAFDAVGNVGSSVGSSLTAAASGTAVDGAVSTIVNTLSALGTILGAATSSAASAVIFGAVIGVMYSLIFDR
ncbi:MAG: hypothetical protein SR2Q5_01600 [Quinella sp. 2Q5]|nr:hypothetical protein [Quinella sp. 2Q5]